jgi:hypothetical protein
VNKTLWVVQVLLALVFLGAGLMKLVLPIDQTLAQMNAAMPGLSLSGSFLQFIGVCETLGGLAMILPGLLKIRPGLTPLAAAGLVVIMVGATTLSLLYAEPVTALIPLTVGLLAAFVAFGRTRRAPLTAPAYRRSV